jgi:hypothetical protein
MMLAVWQFQFLMQRHLHPNPIVLLIYVIKEKELAKHMKIKVVLLIIW